MDNGKKSVAAASATAVVVVVVTSSGHVTVPITLPPFAVAVATTTTTTTTTVVAGLLPANRKYSNKIWSCVGERCPMCHKFRKSFHCKTCVANGDFGHSSTAADRGR